MKTLRIGIASYDRMKQRTMAIARGEHKPANGEPTVWFTSIESFAKVLSGRNRELLATIAREKPDSLTELAELAGRNKSNLSRTLKTMSRYGLV
ncbi:MAG: helix-turn-helix domain-containing protein [Rhodospirillales bacterium]|nr:helix-turn-helix domain-containing protein [Rhodospirillales bacterium]